MTPRRQVAGKVSKGLRGGNLRDDRSAAGWRVGLRWPLPRPNLEVRTSPEERGAGHEDGRTPVSASSSRGASSRPDLLLSQLPCGDETQRPHDLSRLARARPRAGGRGAACDVVPWADSPPFSARRGDFARRSHSQFEASGAGGWQRWRGGAREVEAGAGRVAPRLGGVAGGWGDDTGGALTDHRPRSACRQHQDVRAGSGCACGGDSRRSGRSCPLEEPVAAADPGRRCSWRNPHHHHHHLHSGADFADYHRPHDGEALPPRQSAGKGDRAAGAQLPGGREVCPGVSPCPLHPLPRGPGRAGPGVPGPRRFSRSV